MLEGFGLAPVCIELDLDSYDGDWRHVARFRGRSGWLTVVEAQLRTPGDEWNTTLVAACDEWGEPVPSFMAPNLLGCACSLPQPCSEYPPEELDHIIESEKAELKRRWVREHNAALKQLDSETAETIEVLEAEAKHRIALRDAGIAELRMRRRMAGISPEHRATLSELISELENEQDEITETLAVARSELRSLVAQEERQILRRLEIRVGAEPLYYVNWRGGSSIRGSSLSKSLWLSLAPPSLHPAEPVLSRFENEPGSRQLARSQRQWHNSCKTRPTLPKPQLAVETQEPPAAECDVASRAFLEATPIPQSPPIVDSPIDIFPRRPAPGAWVNDESHGPEPIVGVNASWTAERIVLLRQLWLEGVPAMEIARRLGGVSHNRVIGKAYRIGLPKREGLASAQPAQPRNPTGQDQPKFDSRLEEHTPWTADRVELLERLWHKGLSARMIGKLIGGISRNAVIGKAKRLGLPLRENLLPPPDRRQGTA